ncbi:MAG: YlxR family protein [Streptosporangiaceae bacterium]
MSGPSDRPQTGSRCQALRTRRRDRLTPGGRIGPVRTGVGCRVRAAAFELLRIVVVEGALVPDSRGRLSGRGAWVHLDRQCLDLAERRRAFPRAFRCPGPFDVTALREYVEAHIQDAGASAKPKVGRNGERSMSTSMSTQP